MQVDPCSQSDSLFGDLRPHWMPLEAIDFHFLGLPDHLADQVFRIIFIKRPAVHIFEITVSEQCPKDAYAHLVRGLGKLRIQTALINVVHSRSVGAHLMIWDRAEPRCFHHVDFDFTQLAVFQEEVIARTREPHTANLASLLQLARGKDMGERFFQTLRNHLKRIPCKNETQYHALVDLILKIVFLIFVQRKGWLNFDPYYLESKMRFCHEKHLSLIHCFFTPLFARLEGFRIKEPLSLGDLPRLGGGMFAFNHSALPNIPNGWFLALYRALISRYTFSLFEARDGRNVIGIGPEMLGHVFEHLLFKDDRKRHGVFYTPHEVAEKQVRTSMAAFVRHNGRGNGKISRGALWRIRVLDPSCGSGTYLVAAFQALLKLHLERAPREERYNGKLYRLKRRIMLENLYGVDVQPMAIRLTEVRLWLNMIQDLEVSEPSRAPSLPNLQHHLRPGDFLGRHLPGTREQMATWPKHEQLEQLRSRFPGSSSGTKTTLLKHIYRLENELTTFLEAHSLVAHDAVAKTRNAQSTLPGHQRNRSKPTKPRIAPSKHPVHVLFSQVMLKGGFDLIVGNPPWLSAAKITAKDKKNICRNLSIPPGLRLEGQVDLSVYFLATSLGLLKQGGNLGFLMPNKILQARFAEGLRAFLKRSYTIDYLFDYGIDQNTLFKADTFPMALGVSRKKPEPGAVVTVQRKGKNLFQSYLLDQEKLGQCNGIWALGSPAEMALLSRTSSWPKLSTFPGEIRRGVVTGAKKWFVFEQPPHWLPVSRMKPLLRGRDIQTGEVRPGAWIYWPFDEGPDWYANTGEEERRWLSESQKLRVEGLRAYLPYTQRQQMSWMIVWRYLAPGWRAALVRQDWIPDQTTYYLTFRDFDRAFRYFAYFNSKIAGTHLRLIAERGKDRFYFYYAHTCKELPMPPDFLSRSCTLPEPKAIFTPAMGERFAQKMFSEEPNRHSVHSRPDRQESDHLGHFQEGTSQPAIQTVLGRIPS